jgi:homoserine O-acetyltransferase
MNPYLVLLSLLVVAPSWAEIEQQFADIGDLRLESGEVLRDVRVGFLTVGELNADKSNVILFPTWFTGTARNLLEFEVIGPGKLADTDKYHVIAVDALANGVSTSPSNSAHQSGAEFPVISIGDMVNSQRRLLTEHLGIHHVYAVMGISMGGMQTFDWMGRYPKFMEHAVPIDGSPKMTSYDLLLWQVQKDLIAVMQDAGRDNEAISGLVGRVSQLALQTPRWFVENVRPEDLATYLAAAVSTFDSYDYSAQLDAMIGQDVFGDSPASRQAWFDRVAADVLVIGGTRDHMVNQIPAQTVAEELGAELLMNDSFCGHLGNVCERDRASARVSEFLQ